MTKLCGNQVEQRLCALRWHVEEVVHVVLCWDGLRVFESLSLTFANPGGWRQLENPVKHFASCPARHARKALWSPIWDRALCGISAKRSPLGVLEQPSLVRHPAIRKGACQSLVLQIEANRDTLLECLHESSLEWRRVGSSPVLKLMKAAQYMEGSLWRNAKSFLEWKLVKKS
mmetsp:Transcript_63836/g.117647  ORF Transcript_63836/g.117647 Transcript_63836/m.117647 type:complete len:173 (+) Transcript_63836:105-623(+)